MADMLDPLHRMTYAISDPHGCLDVLDRALSAIDLSGDAHLYLLGDYIPHEANGFGGTGVELPMGEWLACCVASLEYVRTFARAHRAKVSVLPGNHELMLLARVEDGELSLDHGLLHWLRSLMETPYRETERQVFVHAAVDEDAGAWWRWGSDLAYHCCQFPPHFGRFEKDVVVGHVGARQAARLAGVELDDDFRGVFWDGESHYCIDATTERSGELNILCYDTGRRRYTQRIATAAGVSDPLPVEDVRQGW